jgi:hypothetical protein
VDLALILLNLLNPPVLFFFLGLAAVLLKSDLEIPQPIPRFLSLYLLFSIGIEGGVRLRESGLNAEAATVLGASVLMAALVPLLAFPLLRRKLDVPNAAAIAATYGSISAVTFLTGVAFLERTGQSYSGHLVASMALMESPAIMVAVMLARRARARESTRRRIPLGELAREAFLNGSVFLLIGSLVIGTLGGASAERAIGPFTRDIFRGMLAFFLLDMGIVAGKRIANLKDEGSFLIIFAIVFPVLNALAGVGIAWLIGTGPGDALLFALLCGSASYIAVPAAMRLAVPEANPSLYVPMALAVTFPLNIVLGIPLYSALIDVIWR